MRQDFVRRNKARIQATLLYAHMNMYASIDTTYAHAVMREKTAWFICKHLVNNCLYISLYIRQSHLRLLFT